VETDGRADEIGPYPIEGDYAPLNGVEPKIIAGETLLLGIKTYKYTILLGF
jgi:hypothetical protein